MKRTIIVAALLLSAALAGASTLTYNASLSGPAESPANTSPGSGFAVVTYDPVTHLLSVSVTFAGLLGNSSASHIHCCTTSPFTGTAPVATQVPTFSGFPLGVKSGTYANSFDLTLASSWNPTFITSSGGSTAQAEAALAAALNNGASYLNVHSSVFGGGEIRGFLVAAPEPGTLLLLGSALAGFIVKRRGTPRQKHE